MITPNDKKRVLSAVMDFIRSEGLQWNDDFPIEVAERYCSLIEKFETLPQPIRFYEEVSSIKTDFFKINHVKKRDFYSKLSTRLRRRLGSVIERRRREPVVVSEAQAERVYVDDIDSFALVKKVRPNEVASIVPVSLSEKYVKQSLADIIGERFVPKDWAGEKSDLYTTQVVLRGKRVDAAFLLKGPSVDVLTIGGLGTRGNQVLKLTKEPATLFVVQHVGKIESDVIEHLESEVTKQSKVRGVKVYYCVIDGTDTARILKAYNRLS